MAKVTFTPDAWKEAAALPKVIRIRLLALVERLEKWPDVSGAKPLRGDLAGLFRIRTGDYRVLFRVEGDDMVIVKVGHRDGFYEG
jgi:mRNA interferase RelE/StbE